MKRKTKKFSISKKDIGGKFKTSDGRTALIEGYKKDDVDDTHPFFGTVDGVGSEYGHKNKYWWGKNGTEVQEAERFHLAKRIGGRRPKPAPAMPNTHEFGTNSPPARPFLKPAMNAAAKKASKQVGKLIANLSVKVDGKDIKRAIEEITKEQVYGQGQAFTDLMTLLGMVHALGAGNWPGVCEIKKRLRDAIKED